MAYPQIDKDLCTACGICVDDCPGDCFDLEDVAVFARKEDCTETEICYDSCPNGAITMVED